MCREYVISSESVTGGKTLFFLLLLRSGEALGVARIKKQLESSRNIRARNNKNAKISFVSR